MDHQAMVGRLPTRRRRATPWLAFFGVIAGALVVPTTSTSAAEGQFTFFDDQALQSRADAYAQPTTEQPDDWTSPVDYVRGRVYVRLDVEPRPSTKQINVQLCVWRNSFSEESCSPQKRLSTGGVQWLDFGRPGAWWKKGGSFDWDQPVDVTRLMLKDPTTGKLMQTSRCGAACYTGDDVDDHMPISFRAHSVVVQAGTKLVAPTSWDGCPAWWSPACPYPANEAPVVDAGDDRSGYRNHLTQLAGSITDDGEAPGPVTSRWSKVSGPGIVRFTDPRDPETTATFSRNGTYVVRLTGRDSRASSKDEVVITIEDFVPQEEMNVAALVSSSPAGAWADRVLRQRLFDLGYEVMIVDDNKLAFSIEPLAHSDIVVIAPSVAPFQIKPHLAEADVPLLNLKAQAHLRLRLGTKGSNVIGRNSLDIVDEQHTIASGLSGNVVVSSRTTWGRSVPVDGADVIGTQANRPADVTLFAVEEGVSLTTGVAADRRVGYYLGPTTSLRLNDDGWALFDSSVRWLDVLESAPPPG